MGKAECLGGFKDKWVYGEQRDLKKRLKNLWGSHRDV